MSEARPITNVTDFVCGACWSSFSRTDPGVQRGNTVVCPHCGHAMPIDGGDVVSAVNAATQRTRSPTASDGFDSPGQPTLPGHEFAEEAGFPELDSRAVAPWLPPDLVARSSEPAGFIVGDADDVEDFDFNEQTLRPDLARPDLLAAVNAAPTPFSSNPIVADPTPVDFAFDPAAVAAAEPVYAGTLVAKEPPSESAAAAADEGDEPAAAEAEPAAGEADEESAFVSGDWKLRAMGLTYNFHGLDALIGRASSKAGQTMQLSVDGSNWKDFDSFFLLYKSGVPASKALADALDPGAAPATPSASVPTPAASPIQRGTRQTMTGLAAPDLKPASKSDDKGKAGGKGKADAPIGTAKASKSDVPAVKNTVAPAGAVSKRTAAVAAPPKDSGGGKGLIIAIGAVVAVLALIGVLWSQGIIAIPGLK